MEQAGILSWCSLSYFSPQDFIKAEPADALRTRVRPLVIVTCANLLYPWMKKKNQKRFYNTIILAWSMNDTDTSWSATAIIGIFVEISPATFFCYVSVFFFFDLSYFRPLEPALSENESFDLLKVCVNSVISLPPETHTPEKNKEDEVLDPKQRKVIYKCKTTVYSNAAGLSNIFCWIHTGIVQRHFCCTAGTFEKCACQGSDPWWPAECFQGKWWCLRLLLVAINRFSLVVE